MNQLTLSRESSREIDRRAMEQYGMSGILLMENAGRGVSDRLIALGIHGRVVIVCGKGNNGGDGFVIARHLDNHGYLSHVLLLADQETLSSDATTNFEILKQTDVPISIHAKDFCPSSLDGMTEIDWVVDALLGTGAQGDPRPPADAAIDWMNQLAVRKLAVDLPSGLDCDTGTMASCTFVADHTCALVAAKPGFYRGGGPQATGQVHVVDIGVPRRLVEELMGVRSGE